MGAWEPKYDVGRVVSMEAQAAISKGDPVKRVTNGINIAGDGDEVFGVAADDIASGAVGPVFTEGVFEVTFGATIAMGAEVAAAASKQVDGGTSADPVVGTVVDADVSSGNAGRVLLASAAYGARTIA